jgi:LysM repeat protein
MMMLSYGLIKKLRLCVVTILLIVGMVAPAAAQQAVHFVRPGETLASIARLYNVSLQSLAQLNGITNPNLIYAGQRLFIPAPPVPVVRTHVVRPGENLRGIAAVYGTTWQVLAAINNLANPSRIYPGQVLIISATGGPIVQPPPPPPPPVTNRYYTVRPGDTMFQIGRIFGRNVWDIARANGILNLNRIFAGQTLFIP